MDTIGQASLLFSDPLRCQDLGCNCESGVGDDLQPLMPDATISSLLVDRIGLGEFQVV
jgi:hypothetical protein